MECVDGKYMAKIFRRLTKLNNIKIVDEKILQNKTNVKYKLYVILIYLIHINLCI